MLKCCLNVRGELGRGLFVCIIRKKNVNIHINKLRFKTLSYMILNCDSKHYFRIFYEKKRHMYQDMIKYFYTRFNL